MKKKKPLSISVQYKPFQVWICDILLLLFFIIKILGTLWGKCQALMKEGNESILGKGINPTFFFFSSTPSLGANKIK